MYDNELIRETLIRIETSICEIEEWTQNIRNAEDFVSSPEGVIVLNAVCMKLLAVGEEVKSLDKRTNRELLILYPFIPWKEIMGLRDIIAHHYFDVDPYEIFTVIHIDIPPLLDTIRKIKEDTSSSPFTV